MAEEHDQFTKQVHIYTTQQSLLKRTGAKQRKMKHSRTSDDWEDFLLLLKEEKFLKCGQFKS